MARLSFFCTVSAPPTILSERRSNLNEGLFQKQDVWETRHCVYLLRAQFVLNRLPAPGDLVHLDYSGKPVAVRSQLHPEAIMASLIRWGYAERWLVVVLVVSMAACATRHRLALEPGRPAIPLGLDLYLPVPDDNPMTPAKVALGRKLFFDPILSRDQSLACASCHKPERAFTDGRATSEGVFGRKGSRNVPTLINRAYGKTHFWDGRTTSLEQQVLQPIQAAHEMGMTIEEAVKRLRQKRSYRKGFQVAFGQTVDADNLARALASYVRTILSGNAPIDRYMNGKRDALSEQARQGLRLFRGRANCTACHLGPTFSDEHFHNTGIAWRGGAWLDPGRFAITSEEEDHGAFKTPTLRDVVRTAPYMHDGSLATLEDVIEFYDRGGNANLFLDEELRSLHLTKDEKAALMAFLQALSGAVQEGSTENG